MTNIRLGGYTVDDATEIKRRVLGLANSQKMLDGKKQLTVQNQQYYVKLLEPLDAATNPETGYTQANARILRYVQPVDPNSLDMEEAVDVGTVLKITNRYSSFSANIGDLLLVIRNVSEWSPVNATGGTTMKHGLVTECLGGGYYYGVFVDNPMFDLPGGTDQVGTGSGTGTNPLNTDFKEGCNHCLDIEVDPTFVTCGSLNQPPRATLTSGVTGFYCYDPRKLALPSPTHVIVADLGDTVEVYPSGESSFGTGTGTAIEEEKLWMVLTGTYPLVAIPDRYYKCCDGEVILVRCDNFIVEGYYCPGSQGDCPTPGTGTPGGGAGGGGAGGGFDGIGGP